jgi:hypothetical protein
VAAPVAGVTMLADLAYEAPPLLPGHRPQVTPRHQGREGRPRNGGGRAPDRQPGHLKPSEAHSPPGRRGRTARPNPKYRGLCKC